MHGQRVFLYACVIVSLAAGSSSGSSEAMCSMRSVASKTDADPAISSGNSDPERQKIVWYTHVDLTHRLDTYKLRTNAYIPRACNLGKAEIVWKKV